MNSGSMSFYLFGGGDYANSISLWKQQVLKYMYLASRMHNNKLNICISGCVNFVFVLSAD